MRAIFPTHLGDQQLLAEVKHFAQCEREATAQLIAHLAELDARRLYLAAGFSSLFTYCCDVLALSEGEAYNRIEAARAARRFPAILGLLASASVSLTTVRLLAPHLTVENHESLLAAAEGRTKREVEELVAHRFPRSGSTSSIRKLPAGRPHWSGFDRSQVSAGDSVSAMAQAVSPTDRDDASRTSEAARADVTVRSDAYLAPGVTMPPAVASSVTTASASASSVTAASASGGSIVDGTPIVVTSANIPAANSHSHPAAAAPRPAVIAPLSAELYQIKLTVKASTRRKLRVAQDLLRHAVPSGDLAEIFDRALSALVDSLAKKKCATVETPARREVVQGSSSRHVPARVRRAVWVRDLARCAFVAASGRRCGETGFLEFHHVEPFAAGGQATVDNIQLRCRAHNGYEATLFYGAQSYRRNPGAGSHRTRRSAGAVPATRSGTSSARPPNAQPPVRRAALRLEHPSGDSGAESRR